jgi:pyroglutamyl-peptidase
MRLLIYGFGRYGKFQTNVSGSIVRTMPRRRWIKKLVFSVRFERTQFIAAIKKYKPDVVLGLGQCSRGRRLRIESTAVNRQRNSKSGRAKPIVAGGAKKLLTNLRLDLGRQARSSNFAGDYVCNFSMYVILDFLKRRRLFIRYGFIHIPHRYHAGKASRSLLNAVGRITPARRRNF